jgi:hypothetical protein
MNEAKQTYFLFAEQRKVKQDFQRLGVGRQDDEFGYATIESLRSWDNQFQSALFDESYEVYLHLPLS